MLSFYLKGRCRTFFRKVLHPVVFLLIQGTFFNDYTRFKKLHNLFPEKNLQIVINNFNKFFNI